MISFKSHSGIHTLEAKQFLPISLEEAWEFFTNPANLQRITPTHMGFEITSDNLASIYAGQIITYKVSPLPGIKTNWVTEITHVENQKFFVDEQRFGPYSMWHHEHIFEEADGGVLMKDRVSYKVPLGFIGNLVNRLMIRKQLRVIFSFREKTLNKLFPKPAFA